VVAPPHELSYARHVYHVYAVRAPDRDDLQQALLAAEIHTGVHYPVPVHLQPAYADLGYQPGDFPQAERASRDVLSLPLYPELGDDQVRQIAAIVQAEGARLCQSA
jgi:dTDP-4-amino-4,6-dideoxygalactose transaminase